MKSDNRRKPAATHLEAERRDFIKGMGAAAAAALGVLATTDGVEALAQEPRGIVRGQGPLTAAPVVMLWRRVSTLQKTKAFVGNVLGLPVVGEDPVSIMYDAGGALVGYSIPDVPLSNDPVYAACSEIGMEEFYLQNNPAVSLRFVPRDFAGALRNLHNDRKLSTPPERNASGEVLQFVDDDGNFSSFYRPSQLALRGAAGDKLAEIVSDRPSSRPAVRAVALAQQSARPAAVQTPLVGLDLLVSDLGRSKQFYNETLGLPMLDQTDTEAKFDLGRIILTLRVEPTSMLVQFLRKSGRLLGDWIVFHVDDIQQTTQALRTRKVDLPAGIETSLIGDIAYFTDPDGYSLNVWKPSGRTKMIDFVPPLRRILSDVSGDRLRA